MSDSSRFTSGLSVGRLSLSDTPAARHAQISQASCSPPDSVTAIAWLRAVNSGSCAWKNSSAAISVRLSRIGAAAAIQKRCSELRMPPSSETRLISSR